jgi:hypothetical protein
MPILIVLTLVPPLSFYVYVLVQFWAEARRRRHDTLVMIVPLQSISAREDEGKYNSRDLSDSGSSTSAKPELPTVSEFVSDLAEIDPPARASVVATYLRNRVDAFQSGTGRLAVRRSAKG